jgi:cysteinyl-tRNA synthetase
LWKKAEPEHIMQWNSPWGRGYPGWHVECSAMSMKYLGDTLDIHGGGMENQFPHHECEIAQSEAATGKPFVRYWMHHNMVMVEGTKMSKSLANFTSVQDALKNYTGTQIRFFILQTHYRSPVDFADESIVAASQGLQRLRTTRDELVRALKSAEPGEATDEIKELCKTYKSLFEKEMNDDFNTPAAIGQLFNFSREINARLSGDLSAPSIKLLSDSFDRMAGDVLGLFSEEKVETVSAEPFIDVLVDLRTELRAQEKWELADKLRAKLASLGVVIKDEKDGSIWSLKKE